MDAVDYPAEPSGDSRRLLITGGAGYIGSHAIVAFIEAGYSVLVLDDLSNSYFRVFDRIEEICGQRPEFFQGDVGDEELLDRIFTQYSIDGVVHFAGHKAVGESTEQPLMYYQNNVSSSLVLFRKMKEHGCTRLVFSSSATVYGNPEVCAYTEDLLLNPVNPYGRTKRMVEDVLRDLAAADSEWRIALLRYFNPVGAHPSGIIGEEPRGVPGNLVPYIGRVAAGDYPCVRVFGGDYDTVDGSCVRDFIHVQDLVRGHMLAYQKLDTDGGSCRAYNLGTGRGCSVLEVIAAYSEVVGREISYELVDRRPGDLGAYFAVPEFSREELGWNAELNLMSMVEDHWRWQQYYSANIKT